MENLTPGEIQCNVCNGIFELKVLSERTSKVTKTIDCPYCKNLVGIINTPNKVRCIEIPLKH